MSFKDTNGREYVCIVNLGTVIRLKKELNININEIGGDDLLTQLTNDPELLVNVLYLISEGSALQHKISQDDFAQSLGGDSLEAAVDEMLRAIVSFFPPLKRGPMTKILEKSKQVEQLASDQVMAKLEQTTPQQLLTSFVSAGNKSASAAPASHSTEP